MKCPNCLEGELTKTKIGYVCLNCGYHAKTVKEVKSAAPAARQPEIASPKINFTKAAAVPEPEPKLKAVKATVADSVKETDRVSAQEPDLPSPPLSPSTQPVATPKPEDLGFDRPPPRPVRTTTLMIVALGVVILLALAYIIPAVAAANAFHKKLAAADSFAVRGNLSANGQSFMAVLNSNLNFNGSVGSKGSQINYKGTLASRDYTGELATAKSQLFFKMTGNDLPFIRYNQGISTYRLLPDTWYQTKTDTSLYKYYCETRPDTKYPSPINWYQAVRQVKLRPSALVGFGKTVNGHSTTHLRGSISGKDLNKAWASINSGLPPGCQWSNLIQDVSGLKVTYDLWTSPEFDRIAINYKSHDLGISGSITLDLDQYNQAAAPTLPAVTQDLAQIFAIRAVIQTRDYQRRSHIDSLNTALDSYYAANKQRLPTSLARLAPTYIANVPTDPNGTAYVYSVSGKTYTLTATLEDAGQQYTVTGPGASKPVDTGVD